MFSNTFAILALAASSSAHMIMKEPPAFPNTIGSLSAPNNAPLQEDGSDYPCKSVGSDSYVADFSTSMALGSDQTLAFMGSAVHGGGSCQVSITYDEAPTKQSVFKVIYSVEGGCPAKNQAGNFPADATLDTPDKYGFSIPDDIPAGKAVLAWTWFNRIGNREMYMNCAPITLTGEGGDISNFNALPDIMVANIGEKKCTVAEGNDVKFPNPGSKVDEFPFGEFQDVSSQADCSFNWMAGSGPGSAAPPAGDDSGSDSPIDSPAGSPEVEAPAVEAPTPDEPARKGPSPTVPGGVFVTTAPSVEEPSVEEPTESATPEPEAPVEEEPAPVAEPTPAPTQPSDPATGGACTSGYFKCTGDSYSQCVHGAWTPARALAAGTTCTAGEGPSLDIHAVVSKRGMRPGMLARAFHS